jgi:hypothetical protein
LIEEILIPYCDFNDWRQLVVYRDFREGYADEFILIRDTVLDDSEYPIDSRIEVVTSIGISTGTGDSITVEMKSTVF